MKQNKIIKAYNVLDKMSQMQFSLKTSYNIMKLKKQLQTQYDFQSAEQQKAFDAFNGKISENNQLYFQNVEDMQAFSDKLNELADLDIDIDIKSIEIALTEEISITPQELQSLEGFVNFI